MKKKIDPILFEKIIRKTEEYAKISRENKNIAKQWLKIAEEDIQISEILYNNKYYPGAIYHLQQAFEKLTKGYYILSGRLDPKKARGHNFILNRLIYEIKNEDINDFIRLNSLINDKEINIDEANNILDNISKSEETLRNISLQDIASIFNFIYKVEEKIKSNESLDNLERKTHEKGVFNLIKHLILKITHFRTRNSQIQEIMEQKKIIEYIDDSLLGIKIHYLSLITFLHSNTPRYPYDDYSKLNFFSYTEEYPLIKYLPKFIDSFKEINFNLSKW